MPRRYRARTTPSPGVIPGGVTLNAAATDSVDDASASLHYAKHANREGRSAPMPALAGKGVFYQYRRIVMTVAGSSCRSSQVSTAAVRYVTPVPDAFSFIAAFFRLVTCLEYRRHITYVINRRRRIETAFRCPT